ncbi:MAG: RtcB family protein [Gammaproteobacteria bacterium]|nr:RtcB family protein [Gammaproteobacteria bacterium]MDH5727645.1 RtcB family protein [Gammaproteobacteria bacterium]
MTMKTYNVIGDEQAVHIKAWTDGVLFDANAQQQLQNIARLPFVHGWVAAMPDVHVGKGATVGSVIPTVGAIIPAAVGVDIGCGMMAVKTSLKGKRLPDNLAGVRTAIEAAVPHGRTKGGGRNDRGAWHYIPARVSQAWASLADAFDRIAEKHPKVAKANHVNHLGTLGTGNHFIEVCMDEQDDVWVMLHSGSRGVGNRIGSYFIELAKKDMGHHILNLPDRDLAYLNEGTEYFDDYVQAVHWAQAYAAKNREVMMDRVMMALRETLPMSFQAKVMAVNCHHNYVAVEHHFGEDVYVTRKGAVRAGVGEYGIIPGSMGARSYIVKGKGNAESFCSCSHGAGRVHSRTEAKKRFSLDDHVKATHGVECRKDKSVIDETPAAYKDIDKVMAAQSDLVEVVHTLKQVVCVKG